MADPSAPPVVVVPFPAERIVRRPPRRGMVRLPPLGFDPGYPLSGLKVVSTR